MASFHRHGYPGNARRNFVEELSVFYERSRIERIVADPVFRCSVVGGRLTTTDEVLSVGWFSIDEIQHHMDPAYVVRVVDAFAERGRRAFHDGINLMRV